jgi:hypothetical protein
MDPQPPNASAPTSAPPTLQRFKLDVFMVTPPPLITLVSAFRSNKQKRRTRTVEISDLPCGATVGATVGE